jgi:polyisoprenoid-binding protein YceI
VKASVAINGTFDKWDATLTFTSTDVTTGVLDIKVQADSINTGSGLKDDKLKGKDFFDVKEDPLITFLSKKIVQTGPNTFDVQGDFTIRGASKPETLTLTVSGEGTGSGEIHGTMAFDRKDYGMTKNIPFVKIADTVEVTVDLKGKRVSGPPLDFKRQSTCNCSGCHAATGLWSMVNKESVNTATETTNHRWSAVSSFVDPLKMVIQ